MHAYHPVHTAGSSGKSDGSAVGTVLVKDINAGSAGGLPAGMTSALPGATLLRATTDLGDELWITDGTASGTVLLQDINPGGGNSRPMYFTNVSPSLVLFVADSGPGRGIELWRTDGTSAGTTMVKDIYP